MNDLRKAAEMAACEVPLHELLEGVPESARLVIDSEDGMSTSYIPVGQYCKRAAQALRTALAQAEQEWDSRHPKAQALIGERARLRIELWLVEQLVDDPHFETTPSDMEYWGPLHDRLKEALTKPEQEPVGYVSESGKGAYILAGVDLDDDTPLYTAPPEREWVGLTDEEIDGAVKSCNTIDTYKYFRAIEAKLKEKNGG